MKKFLSAVLSIFLLGTIAARAATITSQLVDPFGASNTVVITFKLKSPWALPPNVVYTATKGITATNGLLSAQVGAGNYDVQVGPRSDLFAISVPTGNSTYDLGTLITNGLTFTFTVQPNYIQKAGDVMAGNLSFASPVNAGFILNSLTTTQRNALTGTNGMIVYDATLNATYIYANGSWVNAFGAAPAPALFQSDTNVFASGVALRSLATGDTNNFATGVKAASFAKNFGVGTNGTFKAFDDGAFNAALTVVALTNNLNSENVALVSYGTTSGSILHYENNEGKGVDLGLWSAGFGAPFSGQFHIDLYDQTNLTTAYGPGFSISAGGKYTVVADSGYTDHPILNISATNGTIDFMRWLADNRNGFSGFHFDPIDGVQGLNVYSTNTFTGSGTIAAAGHTITGTSTKFLTELPIGSVTAVGGNVAFVVAVASDTSATTESAYTVAGGSSYSILSPAFSSHLTRTATPNFVVAGSGGLLVMGGLTTAGASVGLKDGSQIWELLHGGSQIDLFNATANTVPFFISDSAPNNSFSINANGGISVAGGVQAGGAMKLPISTKSANYSLTTSDSTIFVNSTTKTMTLPTASGNTGVVFTIKLIAAATTATVATTSSQNIDAATTYSLSAQYKYVTVQSDGTQWWIVANN